MLITTTTVTITRPIGGDPYEPDAVTVETIVTGAAAHVSAPSGVDASVGGDQEQVDAVLLIDPTVGIDRTCLVHDDLTGSDYSVTWTALRTGLGLDHLKAGLTLVRGGSNG